MQFEWKKGPNRLFGYCNEDIVRKRDLQTLKLGHSKTQGKVKTKSAYNVDKPDTQHTVYLKWVSQ